MTESIFTCLCFYSQSSAGKPIATMICHKYIGVINMTISIPSSLIRSSLISQSYNNMPREGFSPPAKIFQGDLGSLL